MLDCLSTQIHLETQLPMHFYFNYQRGTDVGRPESRGNWFFDDELEYFQSSASRILTSPLSWSRFSASNALWLPSKQRLWSWSSSNWLIRACEFTAMAEDEDAEAGGVVPMFPTLLPLLFVVSTPSLPEPAMLLFCMVLYLPSSADRTLNFFAMYQQRRWLDSLRT